jgi:2,3-bisphosphoglycerate-dependent phosphoglycerate mutase
MIEAIQPGTELILVRHGETAWNSGHRIQGHTDVPLSERGRAQAARLAPRLAREPIRACFASDLSRAVQTAEPAAARLGLPVATSPAFREADYGSWEGLTADEIAARFPAEYALWRRDSARHRPPDGESLEALQSRVMTALAELLLDHGGETVCVVAHGGSVRAAVCGLLRLPIDVWRSLRADNTGVSRIAFTPLGPQLVLYNDTAHLLTEEENEPPAL